MKSNMLVLLGAVAGGVVGFFLCAFLLGHFSIKAMAVPGGLLGLGAGIFKCKSTWVAVLCGILALALGLFAEWHLLLSDYTFGYYLSHLQELTPLTLVMIAVGTFIGFWVPFRRK